MSRKNKLIDWVALILFIALAVAVVQGGYLTHQHNTTCTDR